MLELIERFLKHTGIHPNTFGRLTINNEFLVWDMRRNPNIELDDEVRERIVSFMQNYEDIKS